MEDKIEELTSYIQERCLWQFFSRTWDREENIEGILNKTAEILTDKQVVTETPAEKYFYADAKILVSEIKNKFSWLVGMEKDQVMEMIAGVKARLTEITITKSKNCELNLKEY